MHSAAASHDLAGGLKVCLIIICPFFNFIDLKYPPPRSRHKSKMAPTKSNTKPKATRHRKTSGSRRRDDPQRLQNDKENASPVVNAAVAKGAEAKVRREHDANDIREKNWWKVHVAKAAVLIERCSKSLRWDVAEAKQVFDSYRQFLLLKKELGDWDATQLVPCWPVDEMWGEHSQMEDYNHEMKDLLGHVIEHRSLLVAMMDAPTEADALLTEVREQIEEQVRLERTTREALKRRFGSRHDDEMWSAVTVSIVNQLGVETTFEVNRREPLSNAFSVYAKIDKGESIEKYQFSYAGKIISLEKGDREDTPIRLGFGRRAKIEASHIDKAAFTIQYSPEKQRGFLVEKTSMIYKAFEEFAREVMDTERSNLVFVLEDERVYGYESSIALGLKCRDNAVIRAVDAGLHKGKNCICCNPWLAENLDKYTNNEDAHDEDSSDDASDAF